MITETEIYRYAAYFFFFLLTGPAVMVALYNIVFWIKMQMEGFEKRIRGESVNDSERLYLESVEWMKLRD